MTPTTVDAKSWTTIEWLRRTPAIAIPVYQREYRWTAATCDRLLQDIRVVAAKPEGTTHFIGSLLGKPDDLGGLTLVDGQQRITTLLLLLAAVGERAGEAGDATASEVNGILSTPLRPGLTRLRPHERFERDLQRILLGVDDGDPALAENAFAANYRFLLDRIDDDWPLVWQGLNRLEHVTIELGSRSNAQQIFESLNSTGAPLSDDELIHNYVHMGRTHDQQIELELDTWVPIEEATAGATREFWRDYLILKAEKTPDFSGDFGVFRAFKEQFPNPLEDLTPDLQAEWLRYADRYRTILHPRHETDASVAQQLRLLRSFGGTPRPFVLAVYDDYRSDPSMRDMLVATFEQLQTLFIRRALVGLERDIQMVGRLCQELREDGYPVAGIVRRTPEDPSVRLALTHMSLPHAGYVLRRLQFNDRTDLDLQIEHIYPQAPRDEWSGDGTTTWGALSNEEQARYRTVLNTIGNLTLLEADLNQGAGNRSFAGKAAYYRRSEVPETEALADRAVWDAEAILGRTRSLIDEFLQRWPRPSGTPMTEADDLLKVVDLPRLPFRGYPSVFEYAEFNGALWGDVHTSKQLLVRLVDELCRIDYDKLKSAEYGRFVQSQRQPRKSYEKLANGQWLYTGWAHQYLLEVAQSLIAEFGLEDAVKVKPVTPADDEAATE